MAENTPCRPPTNELIFACWRQLQGTCIMSRPTTQRHRARRLGAWPLLMLLPVVLATLSLRPALADKRVALVIGNSAYRSVARLDNPRNDAQLLDNTLRSL